MAPESIACTVPTRRARCVFVPPVSEESTAIPVSTDVRNCRSPEPRPR